MCYSETQLWKLSYSPDGNTKPGACLSNAVFSHPGWGEVNGLYHPPGAEMIGREKEKLGYLK